MRGNQHPEQMQIMLRKRIPRKFHRCVLLAPQPQFFEEAMLTPSPCGMIETILRRRESKQNATGARTQHAAFRYPTQPAPTALGASATGRRVIHRLTSLLVEDTKVGKQYFGHFASGALANEKPQEPESLAAFCAATSTVFHNILPKKRKNNKKPEASKAGNCWSMGI